MKYIVGYIASNKLLNLSFPLRCIVESLFSAVRLWCVLSRF